MFAESLNYQKIALSLNPMLKHPNAFLELFVPIVSQGGLCASETRSLNFHLFDVVDIYSLNSPTPKMQHRL